jgi:hypothetical protein
VPHPRREFKAGRPTRNIFFIPLPIRGKDLERRLQLEVVEVSGIYGPQRVWPAGFRPKMASSLETSEGAAGTFMLNGNAVGPFPLASSARSSRLVQAPEPSKVLELSGRSYRYL